MKGVNHMKKPILPDKVYDILKWVVILGLPSIATLTLAICTIWHLPYGKEIAATITAIDACLGAMLGISTIQYKSIKADTNV